MRFAWTFVLLSMMLWCALGLTPRAALAARCDSNDAAPALAAWQRANEFYRSANYRAAGTDYLKVYRYFAACSAAEAPGWQKYNHALWAGRAEYLYGDSRARDGDPAVGLKWIRGARVTLEAIVGTRGARQQDSDEAQRLIDSINEREAAIIRALPRASGPSCLSIRGYQVTDAALQRGAHGTMSLRCGYAPTRHPSYGGGSLIITWLPRTAAPVQGVVGNCNGQDNVSARRIVYGTYHADVILGGVMDDPRVTIADVQGLNAAVASLARPC